MGATETVNPHGSAEDVRPEPLSTVDLFAADLTALLNRHSMENRSNTPDFILARYLMECLRAWEVGVEQREGWYGHSHEPGRIDGPDVPLDNDGGES